MRVTRLICRSGSGTAANVSGVGRTLITSLIAGCAGHLVSPQRRWKRTTDMGENSKIQWCDFTFNPWIGCVKVSPECDHCYAEAQAKVYWPGTWGKDSPRHITSEDYWRKPLAWNRRAKRRARVLCGSLCDVMEDRPDLHPKRAQLVETIELTDNLDWLLLTKRPQNFRRLLPKKWLESSRPNVWGMTTVGCKSSLWRIGELQKVRFAVHGLSVEPLLEPLDLSPFLRGNYGPGVRFDDEWRAPIRWVIVGGESGPGARPFNIQWARDIVAQCKAANVACFVKQLGSRPMRRLSARAALELHSFAGRPMEQLEPMTLRDKKGGSIEEWPEDLRVRQFPEVNHAR